MAKPSRRFVTQPIKLGGLEIRSLVETSPVAYIGGVEMSVLYFTGREGICPALDDVVGMVEGGTLSWELGVGQQGNFRSPGLASSLLPT